MAKSTEIYLQGKCKWANRLVTPDQKFKCWSVQLYPTQESYSKILELKAGKDGVQGILNTIKKDEEGYSIALKRPTEKLIRGHLTAFLPPVLLKADGSPLGDTSIGNGSDVTCKIEHYTYKRPAGGQGSAIRLVSLRVDNLVVFDKNGDFPPAEAKAVDGLTDQPSPNF